MPVRIVIGRSSHQGDQGGDLRQTEILDWSIKIEMAGKTKTMNRPALFLTEINLVQIRFQDFVFVVMPFQQDRHHCFIGLAPQTSLIRQEEIFHQLLGQGAATLYRCTGFQVCQHGPRDGPGCHAMMVIKITILHRDQTLR